MALPPLKDGDLESSRHTHEAHLPLKADDLGTPGFYGRAPLNARNIQSVPDSADFSMNIWLSHRDDPLSYWMNNITRSGTLEGGQNGSQNTKREALPTPYLRPSTPHAPSSADTKTSKENQTLVQLLTSSSKVADFELQGELALLFSEQHVLREEKKPSEHDCELDKLLKGEDLTCQHVIDDTAQDEEPQIKAVESPDLVETMERLRIAHEGAPADSVSLLAVTLPVSSRGNGSTNDTVRLTSTASANSSFNRQRQSGHKRQRQDDGNDGSNGGGDDNDGSQEGGREPRASFGDAREGHPHSCFAEDCMFTAKHPSWLL